MKKVGTLILVVLLALPSSIHGKTKLPRFEDYPAPKTFKGKPARAKIVGPRVRLFRTMIRNGAATGPNFAGHYTLVKWGCGSSCQLLAIVDARTGRVYIPAGLLQLDTDPWAGGDPLAAEESVQFRRNSRLLVLVGGGYFGKRPRRKGKYFYEWRNNRLKLISSIQRHYY